MSIILGFCTFFLSLFPLWISVLFLDVKSIFEQDTNLCTEYISIVTILVITSIAFIILMYELESHNNKSNQEYVLVSAKEEKTITTEYLISYILPLYTFDFTVWHEVILFLVFFSVFAFLSIRHNNFTVNILLELIGYRLYACELENEDRIHISKMVVCKATLSAQIGESIMVRAVNNEYVVKV